MVGAREDAQRRQDCVYGVSFDVERFALMRWYRRVLQCKSIIARSMLCLLWIAGCVMVFPSSSSLLLQLMGYDVGSTPIWFPVMAVGTVSGSIYLINHEKLAVSSCIWLE